MLDVCEIRIYAQRAGRYIDLTVEDNGPGIEEDILEKLQSGARKPDGLGIGLSNIHQRLRLAFQDEGCEMCIRDSRRSRPLSPGPTYEKEDSQRGGDNRDHDDNPPREGRRAFIRFLHRARHRRL